MWETGTISTKDGQRVEYQVKRFEQRSEYGIDGGRISKLWLGIDGRTVANYDRGWDVLPEGKGIEGIYRTLRQRWN